MSADDTRTCPLPPTLAAAHLADESRCVEQLREDASFAPEIEQVISARAGALVRAVRDHHRNSSLEAFLNEYGLDSEEGIRLMALAEGLLRIPWPETAAKLVRDKLAGARWDAHIGRSPSAVVNAATRVLLMSGRLMAQESGIRSLAQRMALRIPGERDRSFRFIVTDFGSCAGIGGHDAGNSGHVPGIALSSAGISEP